MNVKKDFGTRVRDKLLPYFVFPAVVGVITGVFIFVFKLAASFVMHKSEQIYEFARENPVYLPLLLLGVVFVGLIAGVILKYAKECRGGGIPTATATIRGLLPLKWIQCIFGLFISAMLTYLAGAPLGNEGPSVQMGTAVGKGMSSTFGKKNRAWERYNMTGGASAGFAIATGSPLSGIVFALEELHRRFSPPVFIVAAVSVLCGTATSNLLSSLLDVKVSLFNFEIGNVLPAKFLWIAFAIGLACGISANLLTKLYHLAKKLLVNPSEKISFVVKIIVIFLLVGVLGFVSADFVGSGHSLVETIFDGHAIWHLLLIAFLVRALVMVIANNIGISGGVFVPTLALGAIIASLISDGLVAIGAVGGEYYPILVVIGIASFLSASSRIPLTALTFAVEAMSAAANILPVATGVVISYLVVEMLGVPSFTDTVIESRVHSANGGKTPLVVDSHMRVQRGAFAVGMEIRDILWPYTCTILSISKNDDTASRGHHIVAEGDVLHLHYRTYDPAETLRLLTDILGEQDEDDAARVHEADVNHVVPGD